MTFQSSAGDPASALAAAVAEHFARLGGEEGVAGPPLATLQGLQQEPPAAPVQLGERRHRRVAVEHDLPGHRHDTAAEPGLLREPVEARRHSGRRHEVGARGGERGPEHVGERVGSRGATPSMPPDCQPSDGKRALVGDVGAVDGARPGGRREVAGVLEGHRGAVADRQAARHLEAVDARAGGAPPPAPRGPARRTPEAGKVSSANTMYSGGPCRSTMVRGWPARKVTAVSGGGGPEVSSTIASASGTIRVMARRDRLALGLAGASRRRRLPRDRASLLVPRAPGIFRPSTPWLVRGER